jgi:signal transduction histidine kinase
MNPPPASHRARPFGIRTHLAILSLLVIIFSFLSAFISWRFIRSERLWDIHLDQSLHILSQLPHLRAEIRGMDLTTMLYLRTTEARWLVRRDRFIDNVAREFADMASDIQDDTLVKLLWRAQEDFHILIVTEKRQIDICQKRGKPSPAAALIVRNAKDDLLDSLNAVGDHAVSNIEKRAGGLWRARYRDALLRFSAELLAAAAIALYIYLSILRPFRIFHKAADAWNLGKPWVAPPIHAAWELQRHFELFGEMAKRLNAQYEKERELGELKTKLLSLVSHEFGNALAVIQNAAILLEEKTPASQTAESEPFFRMIEANVELLGTAVSNLLNLSRLEAGGFAMTPVRAAAGDLLQDTAERLGILASKKNIQLSVRPPEQPLLVKADPTLLSLALSNLLSNAIKYTRPGGEVEMGARPDKPGFACLYVKDTGIGIPPDEQNKIFGYYYRTEKGKRMSARGFGIGLAVTRQIIEEHGGALKIESVPERGSTFSFTLPLWRE